MWQGARGVLRATRYGVGAAAMSVACAPHGPPSAPPVRAPANVDARYVRVSLGVMPAAAVSATTAWRLTDRDGRLVARGDSGERNTLSVVGGSIRAEQNGEKTVVNAPPLSLVGAR